MASSLTWLNRCSVVVAAVLASGAVHASEMPVVTLSLSAARVELGAPFPVFLQVSAAPATEVRLPSAIDLGANLAEVGRSSLVKRADGRVVHTFELELVAFDLGELEIPGIPVEYDSGLGPLETKSAPMRVLVYGSLRSSDAEFHEVAPVAVVRTDYSTVYWMLGIFVCTMLVLLVIAWLVRVVARVRDSSGGVEIALDRARRRLDRLEGSGALEAVPCRPAYVEMSEIVREFMEGELGVSALDATTSELEETVTSLGMSEERRTHIVSWLKEADAVKFAGYIPSADEALAALYSVRRWIEGVHSSERDEVEDAA